VVEGQRVRKKNLVKEDMHGHLFDNEFRNLIPPLQQDERIRLEASLKTEGNRDPIVTGKN